MVLWCHLLRAFILIGEYLWAPLSSRGFLEFEENEADFGSDRLETIVAVRKDGNNLIFHRA